jgi:hypothetical protein
MTEAVIIDGGGPSMTMTAHWLHLKLGLPLVEQDDEALRGDGDSQVSEADLIARQKAFAAAPLTVRFLAR